MDRFFDKMDALIQAVGDGKTNQADLKNDMTTLLTDKYFDEKRKELKKFSKGKRIIT